MFKIEKVRKKIYWTLPIQRHKNALRMWVVTASNVFHWLETFFNGFKIYFWYKIVEHLSRTRDFHAVKVVLHLHVNNVRVVLAWIEVEFGTNMVPFSENIYDKTLNWKISEIKLLRNLQWKVSLTLKGICDEGVSFSPQRKSVSRFFPH